MDHRGLDAAFDALRAAVAERDPLGTARATAAFKFHLDWHLAKEDRHLYVLFEGRLSGPGTRRPPLEAWRRLCLRIASPIS